MIDVRTQAHCVQLSPEECRQLYTLLGASAPFVRNQLRVIRAGGGGGVTLSTPDERRDVFDALSTTGRDSGDLTSGLRSLRAALAGCSER
jgi:hypothetical protein